VLEPGEVQFATGLIGTVTPGSFDRDIAAANNVAATNPAAALPFSGSGNGSATATVDPAYARGALIAAAASPGLAPFAGGRIGLGSRFEAGLAYTGRVARIDAQHMVARIPSPHGTLAFAVGLGASAALAGRNSETAVTGLSLASLRGIGADVPLLASWQSTDARASVWGGIRSGFDYAEASTLTSEPRPPMSDGLDTVSLHVTRVWSGPMLGASATLAKHVRIAVEVGASYQALRGRFQGSAVSIDGLSITPATSLWWAL